MKVAGDPFMPSERRYLISRLSRMEIDPRGLDCQVARARAAERHPEFPEAVQSLQDPVRVSTDPFTAEERRYLCTRLPRLELDPRGVDAPVARLRGIDRSQRGALIVQGLREKGLLKLKHEDGRPILVLTSLGKAALKQVFLRQLSNHALLYPALHRQLGVDIIKEK